jgi:hypothetical protein
MSLTGNHKTKMKELPLEKIKPLTVKKEDIEKAISALYAIADSFAEDIEDHYWYYWIVPSKKGLIIETYTDADAHLDEPNHQLTTCPWDPVFSDIFASGGKVNKPMVAAFIKGLNEMMAELKENGEVCIAHHLKQATDLIEG